MQEDTKVAVTHFFSWMHSKMRASAGGELDFAEHLALSAILPANCGGDINNDRSVNVTDLLVVISGWGACP